MELFSVQWGRNSYNLWDLGSKLLWSWRTCESLVSWSVPDVSWLCSKHKSHGWSNNSRANSSHNEVIEKRRSHNSLVCLHSAGFLIIFFSFSMLLVTLDCKSSPQGTLKRRQHLNEAKFFWCNCERCKTSDELSTHCSTLLCPKCPHGFILSVNPLDENAEWR